MTTQTTLEYKVDQNGNVIQIKSRESKTVYVVTGRPVDDKRAALFSKGARSYDRWSPFRMAVVRQKIGQWHEYGPFESRKELDYAAGSVNKPFQMLREMHPGCKVELRRNLVDMSLLVRIVVEKKSPVPRQNGEDNETETR